MNLGFVHGWGGSAEIWKQVAACIPGEHQFYDRGYFGNPQQFNDASGDLDALVLHSMAPLYLEFDAIPANMPVVIVNGFDHFCGTSEGTKRAVQRTLDRMIMQCDSDVVATLEAFHALGGAESIHIPENPIFSLLKPDLQLLKAHRNTIEILNSRRMLAIFSQKDAIAPAFSRTALERNASKVIFADTSSHFLPLTRAAWLAEIIQAWLILPHS